MKANIAIGVDIGGSHVSCAAVNIGKGEILQNTFFENAVDKHASSEIIIQTWGQTILKTIEMVGWDRINGIGFAMPGPFDYVNGISLFSGETQKYENTYGLNVKEAIKNFMRSPGNIKVRFVNDAAAFAIGEAWVGKASEVKNLFQSPLAPVWVLVLSKMESLFLKEQWCQRMVLSGIYLTRSL